MLQADKQAEEHVQQQLCGQSESWQSVPLQLGCSIGSQQDRFAVQKDRLPSKSALPSTNTAFPHWLRLGQPQILLSLTPLPSCIAPRAQPLLHALCNFHNDLASPVLQLPAQSRLSCVVMHCTLWPSCKSHHPPKLFIPFFM